MASVTRVVIVDNHPTFGEQLAAYVRQCGGAVVGRATEAERGLELIREARPEVALIDVGLPRQSGFVLATRVRELGTGARVVLMGANESLEYGVVAAALGAAYLSKTAISERLPDLLGNGADAAIRAGLVTASEQPGGVVAAPAVEPESPAHLGLLPIAGGAVGGMALLDGMTTGQASLALAGLVGLLLLLYRQNAPGRASRGHANGRRCDG